MKQGLGTQLRLLLELLDGDVAAAYEEAGLDYRPRYTPIVRALLQQDGQTLGELARTAGITQPAATQTVALMQKAQWLDVRPDAADARLRRVQLSAKARAALPALQQIWASTQSAADALDAELSHSLSTLLAEAIQALQRQPFRARSAASHPRKTSP
jgi:DNA-binding MarR family transcriptional regulator